MLIAKNKKTYVGVGLYALNDAASLVGATSSQVARWSNDNSLIHRYFDSAEKIVNFAELIELIAIQRLQTKGATIRSIRELSLAAAQRFRTDYPLSCRPFIEAEGDQSLRTLFKQLEFDDAGQPVRYWPRERTGGIVLDPRRKFGQPIEAESGIPTRALHAALKAGDGQEFAVVARIFGISTAAVKAAVDFEQSLSLSTDARRKHSQ